jgi:predicted ATPase
MDAQMRRRRNYDALKRLLVRESLNQPILLICEDLHWLDTETQAFLDVLVESVATARLLLLVNYRPEYQHGWGRKTYYPQMRLEPLGREEAEELLTLVLGAGADVQPLKRRILEQTGGNPFFIEEVVQTLVEEEYWWGSESLLSDAGANGLCSAHGAGAGFISIDWAEDRLLQTLAVIGIRFPALLTRVVGNRGDNTRVVALGCQFLWAAAFPVGTPSSTP